MADAETIQSWVDQAYSARRRQDFDQAVSLYQRVLAELGEAKEFATKRCEVLDLLANAYADLGDYQSAVDTAVLKVTERRKLASGNDILLGNDLMLLAHLLEESGRYSDALPFAAEGVGIYRSVFGEAHEETLRMSKLLSKIQGYVQGA